MKKLKVIGAIATVLGLLAEFISDYVDEREMEELVEEKVQALLGGKENNNEA